MRHERETERQCEASGELTLLSFDRSVRPTPCVLADSAAGRRVSVSSGPSSHSTATDDAQTSSSASSEYASRGRLLANASRHARQSGAKPVTRRRESASEGETSRVPTAATVCARNRSSLAFLPPVCIQSTALQTRAPRTAGRVPRDPTVAPTCACRVGACAPHCSRWEWTSARCETSSG